MLQNNWFLLTFIGFLAIWSDAKSVSFPNETNHIRATIVAWLFAKYDVARGILKLLCKTWEFRATSCSVNSQGILLSGKTAGF